MSMERVEVFEKVRVSLSDAAAVTFTDAELDTWLRGALREYARHRPLLKRATLTTTEGTATYAAPTGITHVTRVLQWVSDTAVSAIREFVRDVPPGTGIAGQMDELLDQQADDAQSERTRPALSVEYDEDADTPGWVVRVDPEPQTTGKEIVYEYAKAHAANAAGDYPSIPEEDTDILADLLLAEAADASATAMSKVGTVKAGDGETDLQESIRDLRRLASTARTRALARLDVGVVGVRG